MMTGEMLKVYPEYCRGTHWNLWPPWPRRCVRSFASHLDGRICALAQANAAGKRSASFRWISVLPGCRETVGLWVEADAIWTELYLGTKRIRRMSCWI